MNPLFSIDLMIASRLKIHNLPFDHQIQTIRADTKQAFRNMLGEEEKKIRKNPAAQTTAFLKEVFGSI